MATSNAACACPAPGGDPKADGDSRRRLQLGPADAKTLRRRHASGPAGPPRRSASCARFLLGAAFTGLRRFSGHLVLSGRSAASRRLLQAQFPAFRAKQLPRAAIWATVVVSAHGQRTSAGNQDRAAARAGGTVTEGGSRYFDAVASRWLQRDFGDDAGRPSKGPAAFPWQLATPRTWPRLSPGARSGQEATALRSERILEVVLLDGCSVYVRRSSSTDGMYVVDRRAKVDGGMDRWPEIVVAACDDHR